MRFLLAILLMSAFAAQALAEVNVNTTLCEGNDLYVGVDVNENTTICTYTFVTPGGSEYYFHDYDCKNYSIPWSQLTTWASPPFGTWKVRLVHQLGATVSEENTSAVALKPFDEKGTLALSETVKSGGEITANASWNEVCGGADDYRFFITGGGQRSVLYEGRLGSRNVTKSAKFTAPKTAGRYTYALKFWRSSTGKEQQLDSKTATVVGVDVVLDEVRVYAPENKAILVFSNLGTEDAMVDFLAFNLNSTFVTLNKFLLDERTLSPGKTNLTFVWDRDFPVIGLLPGTFYYGDIRANYEDTYTGGRSTLNVTFNGTVLSVCGNYLCEYKECDNCPGDCKKEECLGDNTCQLGFLENCLNDCPCTGNICDPSSPKADEYGCAPDEIEIELTVFGPEGPIEDVLVQVGNDTCNTDARGRCSFTLLRDIYHLYVEKDGYFNQSGNIGASKQITLEAIPPAPAQPRFDPTKFASEHKGTFAMMLPLLPLVLVIIVFISKKLKG